MPSNLIVIYGAPLSGKTTLAWELGRSLPAKTAIVSTDQLLQGSLAVPDDDAEAELDMAHVQLRLLVANYMKNRYNVVVEGPFVYERQGALYNFEPDIDQLVALMRHLTSRAVVVRLRTSDEMRASRASASGREAELPVARRVEAEYKDRFGTRFYTFDTGTTPVAEIADVVRQSLSASRD